MADIDLNTDSEDELPAGWEERVTVDGKVFYACHSTEKTQWTHPRSGKRKKVTGELPHGWEKKIGDSGYVYYVDHINCKTTFTDPRLAFAVEDKGGAGDAHSLKQKFDANSTTTQVLTGLSLTGKYAVITGANCGIGFETARALALVGCTVIMACRNVAAGEAAKKLIKKERQSDIHVMKLDLASLKSVRQFAQEYIDKCWPLHMLILNAGILSPPYTVTEDGLELCFQVNYLSHHYLCRLLEKVLVRSAPSRIINVSSESHRYRGSINSIDDVTLEKLSPSKDNYVGLSQYGVTKLLNIAFSNAINRRKVLNRVRSNSLHPGNMIATSLSKNWWGYRLLFYLLQPFTKSLEQGAATTVFVATCPSLEDVGGMYFNNCWVCEPSPLVQSLEFCDRVYQLGERTLIDKLGPDCFDLPCNMNFEEM